MDDLSLKNSEKPTDARIDGPLEDFFGKISKKSFDIFKYGFFIRLIHRFMYVWVGGLNNKAHGTNQFLFLSTEPMALCRVKVFHISKYTINVFYVY